MPTHTQLIDIQKIFNHLGMILLYAPDEDEIYEQYLLPFKEETLIWPLEIENQTLLAHYHSRINWDKAHLQEEWRIVLGGPGPLKAPPYSSVYLDKEQVLYGTGYQAFVDFLDTQGLEFTLDNHIPEDHIGVMFLALSFLVTENKESAEKLLREYLLTWSTTYLTLLATAHQTQYFYRFIAGLAHASLDFIQTDWQITPKDVLLYPYQSSASDDPVKCS